MNPPLKVGRIPFLVCAPFFHRSLQGSPGIDFIDGPPSRQNAWLREGLVELSPTSSLEYALRPDDYVLLPGLCTAGKLEIRSVRLFSQVPWADLQGKPVRLSSSSTTSNALFQILSRQVFTVQPDAKLSFANPTWIAEVAIGDEALKLARLGRYAFSYDLAVEWTRWQNLPFAFGLWLVRRSSTQDAQRLQALRDYAQQVRESVQVFLAEPAAALEKWLRVYPSDLPMADILDFYSSADYAFSAAHAESLQRFFELARQEGIITEIPALRFLT